MYLIQPRCHLGKTIVYDTVSNLSWSVDIRKHGIINVIEEILGKPWQPSEDVGRSVPPAAAEEDCVVSGHHYDPYGTRPKSMELAGML
jgi:lipase ATG15